MGKKFRNLKMQGKILVYKLHNSHWNRISSPYS